MKRMVLLVAVLLGCAGWSGWAETTACAAADQEPVLLSEYWTDDSEAAKGINEYLQAVTDADSPDFIPAEDRIAVFDLDGTLMCETYPFCFEYMVFADYALNSGSETITDEVRAVAQEIMDAAGGEKPDGMSTRQAAAGAAAYSGMTMSELAGMVEEFKQSDAWGFSGMTRGEAWYKPMVELLETLQKNEFTVYIVTATERNMVRQVIQNVLDLPPSHVIGTEYGYAASGQEDTADTDYTFKAGDQVVFDGTYAGENAKMSKVDAIVREIGQQPVLAFGNSSGDLAMEIYTISDNPYRSGAYMVLADDEEREYGNAETAAEKKADYEKLGVQTISMREDFLTIYGDGVEKDVEAGRESSGMLAGGWENVTAEAAVLPEEAQIAFDKATEKLAGASYTPVALLSTQVVAGRNYCILCQIMPVTADPAPSWALVYIYADLDGNAQITNVYELYIDRHA